MPRFLSGQTNQCCCPEMRCCPPETVTITLSGFQGTSVGGWYLRKTLGKVSRIIDGRIEVIDYEVDPDGYTLTAQTGLNDIDYTMPAECQDSRAGEIYNVMMRHDPYAGIYEAGAATGECYDYTWGCAYPETWPIPPDELPIKTQYSPTTIWHGVKDTIFPSIAFPPYYGQGGFNGNPSIGYRSDCYLPWFDETPGSFSQRRSGEYVAQFLEDVSFTAQCASVPKLCQMPPSGGEYFSGASGGIRCETDWNGTYVCHRSTVPLRPELEAVIERTASGQRNTVREEARLIFEVFCRRRWNTGPCPNVIYISGTVCNWKIDPPSSAPVPPPGDYYCVDFRCGPRLQAWEIESACDYLFCQAPIGFAKPRLKAYHELGNQTAQIQLLLEPAQYMSGEVQFNGSLSGTIQLLDKMRKPFSWRIVGTEIKSGGTGYEVGEFFTIAHDIEWWILLGGTPLIVNLPNRDWQCMGGGSPSWKDKYNYIGELENGVRNQYQRLRIAAVDNEGAITDIEVVPWYRDPEFGPGCIERPLSSRTAFYPQYTRALCHPMSVDFGGKGYLRGDTIRFVCKHPSCETYMQATAVVTDVDEEGEIQDWHIRGSDLCNYGYCFGDCIDGYYEPDERGAYKFDGKLLCDLSWFGVGVPVRSVGSIQRSPTTDSRIVNNSGLTAASIGISRSNCRTGIEVLVSDWYADLPMFKDAAKTDSNGNPWGGQHEQAAGLFPPWPKCWGGGSVITPVIGQDGGNDSEIGGPLAGGIVVHGGTGYAFRDKRHVEPILDTEIPSIIGENGTGTGATISDFEFDAVLNFPYPGYMSGLIAEDPQPDRFAYYPVTAITIGSPGTGYEVGMEFDIAPVGGGRAVTDVWAKDGGDNPDVDDNGSFYGGYRARFIHPDTGHYNIANGVPRFSKARARITAVDEDGGITDVEILHGGMMFKPEWTVGRQHPDARIWLTSDTGEGAKLSMTVDTNHESATFGELTAVTVVPMPVSEAADPLYSTPGNQVAFPLGGRDYANPPSGLMWEISDSVFGGGWRMLAAAANELRSFRLGTGHDLIEGSVPPYIRRATRCHLGECYQPLLSKSYPLFTTLGTGTWIEAMFNEYNSGKMIGGIDAKSTLPIPSSNIIVPSGRPPYAYGLFRAKNTRNNDYSGDPLLPVASIYDWVTVMWGTTATIGYVQGQCTDHLNGRTSP